MSHLQILRIFDAIIFKALQTEKEQEKGQDKSIPNKYNGGDVQAKKKKKYQKHEENDTIQRILVAVRQFY